MFELIFKTNIFKINQKVLAKDIMAGIIYDKKKNTTEKIMFVLENGKAKDIFDNETYSLDENVQVYVSNYISLYELIIHFIKKLELNLAEQYMVYKMFLNDNAFINRNLEYFGLEEVEVGYKYKTEIKEIPNHNKERVEIYYALNNIINCKNLLSSNKNNGKERK